MRYELSINNYIELEASSRKVLNIRTQQRYGVDISELKADDVMKVHGERFKVDHFRVRENFKR